MKFSYFKFCPRCATPLTWVRERRREPKQQRCLNCEFTFYNNPIGATDAVIVRAGKVLLVRRNRQPSKGRYDFPGGFLDGFESPERGVIREASEEVGLRFTPKQLLGVYINKNYWWQGRLVPAVVMSYFGTATGRIKPNNEVSKPEWVPLGNNIRMAFRYQHQTLRDLKKFSKPSP